jgi:lipopolysaccharide export system protein LptA
LKFNTLAPYLFIGLLISIASTHLGAQVSQDSTKEIIIENANKQIIDNNFTPSVKYFIGEVRAFHEGSFFYCDSAKLIGNQLYAYGNVVIIQNDTVSIFGDDLFYDGDSLFAYIKSKVVLINDGDKLYTEYLEYDMREKKAYYKDRALLVSDKTELKSKKGTYDLAKNTVHFEERVTIDGEDFYMVTDSLDFDTKNEIAVWNTPAVIDQDTAKIYSKKGRYEINLKKAEFIGDAQYQKKDVIATADKIVYEGLKKDVSLFDHAIYVSATDSARADTIVYNDATKLIKLDGKANFKNKENKAEGQSITYDKKNDGFKLSGRGQIQDSTSLLIADNLDYSKITKIGKASGKVIWKDTSAHTTLQSDSLDIDGSKDYFAAKNKVGKPILSTEVDDDTLHISALVIKRQQVFYQVDSTHIDTSTIIVGDNEVEIFKKDLQGIADSITYNQKDSLFRLFDNPVLWTDTTQMFGDTIAIYMKNKKVDYLDMHSNALVITSDDLFYFNQIRGNKIIGTFKDKTIDQMKVNGNAQCVYYMLDDDKAYIGVNQTDCSLIIFKFEAKKIKDIRFYLEPKSVLSPMDKVNHDEIKLKGFKWELDKRPRSLDDLRF